MNKLMIIGNLTRDPERRTLQDGTPVCVFTVAVNRRRARNGEKEQVDFFRVAAWRELGENCAKYLTKGRKVCVTGPVSANAYTGQDGQARASLEVNAQEVEFISPSPGPVQEASFGSSTSSGTPHEEAMNLSSASDYKEVEPDDLPF